MLFTNQLYAVRTTWISMSTQAVLRISCSRIASLQYALVHDDVCTQQRLRSAWADTQADPSLCCVQETISPQLANERRLKHLTGWMSRLIWVVTESMVELNFVAFVITAFVMHWFILKHSYMTPSSVSPVWIDNRMCKSLCIIFFVNCISIFHVWSYYIFDEQTSFMRNPC